LVWASPAVKTAQLTLFRQFRQLIASGHAPSINETGLRNFSGTDDDGRLLFILAVIGFRSRHFVDIGSSKGLNSNCANLIFNFRFSELMRDGDPANIAEANAYFSLHPDTELHPRSVAPPR
jgi:hypothetical protein